jgi:hypothetical protein
MSRCLHDNLPGQCGVEMPTGNPPCTNAYVPPPPDYEQHRAIVQRHYARVDEPPQVTATTVATPTTDRLRRRLGFDIPTIGYGHWTVLVDDSACKGILEARQAARDAAQREALVAALTNAPNTLGATVTIR